MMQKNLTGRVEKVAGIAWAGVVSLVDTKNLVTNRGAMDSIAQAGRTAIETYKGQIRRASIAVYKRFVDQNGKPELVYAEIEQDARLLVLAYLGLMDGRHFRIMDTWRGKYGPGLHRGLIFKRLQSDLGQKYSREFKVRQHNLPLDEVIPDRLSEDTRDPYRDPRDATIARLDWLTVAPRLRKEYPYLMLMSDGYDEHEIADILGVGLRTVERHIHNERERIIDDPDIQEILSRHTNYRMEMAGHGRNAGVR